MLAERYVGLFIARESLPTLALDRTFIWISFCCDCCPETSQIKPFMSEYNKIISYYSYVFMWLYSEKSKWHTFISLQICCFSSASFPFVFFFLLVFVASFCRFTASRMQWSFVTYIFSKTVRPQVFYSIHRLYTLCVIGIRVIVLSILIPVLAIFVAPYSCSWANQYLASPNMLSVSLYRAWFIHTFLFTGKALFFRETSSGIRHTTWTNFVKK